MKVVIFRQYKENATYGHLIILDGIHKVFECRTLERQWLNNKPNESCIPATGRFFDDVSLGGSAQAPKNYTLIWEMSGKFKTNLWEIYGPPRRKECKFHIENFAERLEGCIAPGQQFIDINDDGYPDITNSKVTLDAFNSILPKDKNHELVIAHEDYPKNVGVS